MVERVLEVAARLPRLAQFDAQVGILRPDWSDVTKPWHFTPISEPGVWYGHGGGVGEINGDGRLDIVNGEG